MNRQIAVAAPSDWVSRFAGLIPAGGTVLDLACGAGRHSRLLLQHGLAVLAVDRDESHFEALQAAGADTLKLDLEQGDIPASWPFHPASLHAIVVTNYLHRPLFPLIFDSLADGGLLIYETFMQGHQQFGKPSNPAFLLEQGELLERLHEDGAGRFQVIAFEQGHLADGNPRMVQRLCARRARLTTPLDLL